MKKKILGFAIGLLLSVGWIASEASAGQIGLCNAIIASAAGDVGKVNAQGYDPESCGDILAVFFAFQGAGCNLLPFGSLAIQKVEGQALENICTAVEEICFPGVLVLNICHQP